MFGGFSPAISDSGKTEEYNGTSWTEVADLSPARRYLAGAGTQSSALAFGGMLSTSAVGTTQEWLGAGAGVTRTFTDS